MIGVLSIVGAVLALIGAFAKGGMNAGVVAAGVLLFFAGFFVTSFASIKVPPVLIVFLIILFIFSMVKRK